MFSESMGTFRLDFPIARVKAVMCNVPGSQSVLEGVKSLDLGRWRRRGEPCTEVRT